MIAPTLVYRREVKLGKAVSCPGDRNAGAAVDCLGLSTDIHELDGDVLILPIKWVIEPALVAAISVRPSHLV